MKSIAPLLLTLFVACSTSPSIYKASTGKEGYSDKLVDSNLKVSTYIGNSATKKETAELYAKFHAIEMCRELNKPLTHILLVRDKTYQKEISQTSTTYPTYYYGASPYYGGPAMYTAYSTGYTQTYNESFTYPLFDVYFECTDRPLDAQMAFKPLSQSQVKDFVNDLNGAVQVDAVLPDSPNKGKLMPADIIIKANGARVGDIQELFQASREAKQENFFVDFIREGKPMKTKVEFADVSAKVKEAQDEIIKQACKKNELKGKNALCK